MSTTEQMSESIRNMVGKLHTSIEIRNIDKKQDYVKITHEQMDYTVGKQCDIIECYDGHGNNQCIDYIKQLNTTDIIQRFREPELEIQRLMDASLGSYPFDSGAVCAFAKIYDNYAEFRHVGDSQICVFVDSSLVYKSLGHDSENADEIERVRDTGLTRSTIKRKTCVLNPRDITYADSMVFTWRTRFSLCPTQSLGHRGYTGIFPTVKRIDYGEQARVDIVVATDGLWDVLNPSHDENREALLSSSASELADIAENRWNQTWNVIVDVEKPEDVFQSNFEKGDDIGVAVWRRSST
jgi:serine/threonine protein phosphatase PrpC